MVILFSLWTTDVPLTIYGHEHQEEGACKYEFKSSKRIN